MRAPLVNTTSSTHTTQALRQSTVRRHSVKGGKDVGRHTTPSRAKRVSENGKASEEATPSAAHGSSTYSSEQLAVSRRTVGFLMQQEMVEQPVGFMRSVDRGEDSAAGLGAIGTAERLLDRWAVTSGTLTNQVQGVAESGIALFGKMPHPASIATLLINRVKPRKGPEMVSRGEALDIGNRRQIAGRMIRADARYTQKHRGARGWSDWELPDRDTLPSAIFVSCPELTLKYAVRHSSNLTTASRWVGWSGSSPLAMAR
jgi:hypothetical protein